MFSSNDFSGETNLCMLVTKTRIKGVLVHRKYKRKNPTDQPNTEQVFILFSHTNCTSA